MRAGRCSSAVTGAIEVCGRVVGEAKARWGIAGRALGDSRGAVARQSLTMSAIVGAGDRAARRTSIAFSARRYAAPDFRNALEDVLCASGACGLFRCLRQRRSGSALPGK